MSPGGHRNRALHRASATEPPDVHRERAHQEAERDRGDEARPGRRHCRRETDQESETLDHADGLATATGWELIPKRGPEPSCSDEQVTERADQDHPGTDLPALPDEDGECQEEEGVELHVEAAPEVGYRRRPPRDPAIDPVQNHRDAGHPEGPPVSEGSNRTRVNDEPRDRKDECGSGERHPVRPAHARTPCIRRNAKEDQSGGHEVQRDGAEEIGGRERQDPPRCHGKAHERNEARREVGRHRPTARAITGPSR